MGVPKDIRDVPRPEGTIVQEQRNKNGTRYYVRQRLKVGVVNGRKIMNNGPIIGEIIDGRYVENLEPAPREPAEVDMQTWAMETVIKDITQDVLDDLRAVFGIKDGQTLYVMSILRVRRPGLKDSRMRGDYESSILSDTYQELPMSKNKISSFLEYLGLHNLRIRNFLKMRIGRLPKGVKMAVDGILVTDNSIVDSLSEVSRKSKARGGRELSMLYAYSIDNMEPVCYSVYPGNTMDSTAYASFIEANNLKDALLIGDKAFTAEAAKKQFKDSKRCLHYLFPIRRNSEAIKRLHLHKYNQVLATYPGVSCLKVYDPNDEVWYYSFRDASRAALDEKDYLEKIRKTKKDLNPDELQKMKERFGTIIYRSDIDLTLVKAYEIYQQRWLIEEMFRLYKDIEEFDETREQNDASVFGSSLVNFLSTLMTSRLMKRLDAAGVLNEYTFGEATETLRKTLRFRETDGSWTYMALRNKEKNILRKLDLITQLPPKRGPGRPRKTPQ